MSFSRLINTTVLHDLCHHFRPLGPGTVRLCRSEGSSVATLCLSNTGRKNAISGQMMAEMSDVLSSLELWSEGKAVIVLGEENFFCSGGDLNTVRQMSAKEDGRRMSRLMHHNFARLQSLPQVSLALIQGMALGGGAEMATACDFRLATRSARIGFVHSRLGIVSAWGGGARLCALVGPQVALDLMLTAKTVNSEEALRLGLIDDVIEDEDNALEVARAWIESRILAPIETVRAVKGIVDSARQLPLEEALREELELSVGVWGGRAHIQALAQNVKHA